MNRENEADSAAHAGGTLKRLPRLFWFGLAALVLVLIGAVALGPAVWRHHQFEKERTETLPHVIPDLNLKLLWVPAGEFVMGAEEPSRLVEGLKGKYNGMKPASWPVWKARLPMGELATIVRLTKGFYLGEAEVTQQQWVEVMGANPSRRKGPQFPVTNVTRADCVAFCAKLTERERGAGRLDAKQRFRLPTEVEWEYACRAGTSGNYCFGNDKSKLGDYAWFSVNALNKVQEVARLKPNPWGFFDMHGNVQEWCDEYLNEYPGGMVIDPRPPVGKAWRFSCRGGSAADPDAACTSALSRFPSEGLEGNRFLGFRIVLATSP